ncbi:MAG: fibronectin type III domain-containing protein [Bacillota bacterium]
MPSLIFSDATSSGFNWQVTGLSSAWNSSNYTQIVLSSGTTSEGSTSAPSGVVGSVSAPGSGSSTSTPKTYIGGSAGTTYNRNAYAQAANGRYYYVGSNSITLPNSTPPPPNTPSNISFTVNGKNITAHYTKGGYYVHLDYSWINGYPDAVTTALSYSFTVPEYDTYYSVDFQSENMDGQKSGWSGFKGFYSGSAPNPPSQPRNLTATPQSKSTIFLDWDSSSTGSPYGYDILVNNLYATSVTSGTSYLLENLNEYTSYTIKVVPYNSYGDGTSATVVARTLDQTAPTVDITAVTTSNSRISIAYSGNDPHSGIAEYQVYISLPDATTLYYKTSLDDLITGYTFETDGTGNPLIAGKTYRVGVKAIDASGNVSTTDSEYYLLPNTRPNNWSWYTAKTSGGNFSLTSDEWFKFCTRINDFRSYKNLSYYGFTDATSGGSFYAYMFNQARSAIVDLPRSVSLPSAVSSGDYIYAYQLNQLRDALNSTT